MERSFVEDQSKGRSTEYNFISLILARNIKRIDTLSLVLEKLIEIIVPGCCHQRI